MRKLGMFMLALVIGSVVIMAGCSKKENVQESSPASTATGTTAPSASASDKEIPIKLWIYPMIMGKNGEGTGNPDDFAKEYARQFKEQHPNANVSVEILDWAGGTEKLDVAVAAGSPPDLVYTINNFGAVTKYGKMGALEPIDDYLKPEDWDDYSDSVKGAMKYGDKNYLWPWLKLVSGVAINLDLFKEKNAVDLLPLNRPLRDWTYDEYLKAAQATTFSRSGGSKPDVFGTSIWGKDGPFFMYLYGVGNGGNLVNDSFDKSTITDPKFKEGIQFMADLAIKYKVASPGSAGLSVTNASEMFLNQQVAMYPGGTDILDSVAKSPKPFEVAFVAPPHGKDQPTAAWNNVGGFIVFKQKDEEKKKMVMEFARFITDTEHSKIVKATGSFPARNSSGNLYGDDANMAYFNELSKYGNSQFSRAFGLVAVSDWEKQLQAILTGISTVDDSLNRLDKLLTDKLK
ncbi:ABC transporter substrate-binding protein [Cohnella silvisoli]|uniref:Sugar ABC transporter substrate-binding protein n=1 Tax=Cohnella silvisoli TaxID=2873699 RepID=A0ABV1L0T9_9BACL|nr:sugar ABC transporter substrate-binding protein [Cohnella silvisoli]MCD9025308.1 sugar ABC transporter substrate-binding protein [Cohnella silvisoli]